MAYRVAQQMIYGSSVNYMNTTLSQLMESNLQASSQKKVNRPSDDPVGMSRILSYRDNLAAMDQYETNISMAEGWLNLADNTMVQTNTVVTRLKELAEQGSTGTLTGDNRSQIAAEARQLFQQLVAMGNTEFDGKSIFAGQKTNINPYEETLTLTTNQAGVVSNAGFRVNGYNDKTTLVQFLQSGALASGSTFRWTSDGGNTWNQGTVSDPGAPDRFQLSLGGVTLELDRGTAVTATAANNTNDSNGTWMWVRPTAIYKGDDEDSIAVDPLQGMGSTVTGTAAGVFANNVIVRIDQAGTLGSDVGYSYSLDGGVTWVLSNVSTPDASSSMASLNIPGGVLTLHSNGGNALDAGDMFIVRPRKALIMADISPTERIALNGIGKNIFGGIYQDPASNAARPVVIAGYSGATNLFETVGKLVAFLETNNQSGVQQCLADLRSSSQTILNYAADVGARENRLIVSKSVLDNLKLNQTEQLSTVEDVDISELMTRLAQQQLAYQSVLKSTSMIMNLSLMNYL
ncbi:Flagellar hook-associated protein 3 [Fundidesulfovibrio magnetotacticus]|uniref:Flagellar hook-associated protein 3 n=1 Tax=Fundidesulfovibrio magnetotacticus TaxID=2730080 RepID=A0A6V8LSV3_9BACT|nr:flagellar hook-associated protein FlgL [Fundidesulfovibrio magnetotacticus]GFK92697.1 Flagellar hook-associated protein 3 [Fundidesulfovibrio magnetotacticus]